MGMLQTACFVEAGCVSKLQPNFGKPGCLRHQVSLIFAELSRSRHGLQDVQGLIAPIR